MCIHNSETAAYFLKAVGVEKFKYYIADYKAMNVTMDDGEPVALLMQRVLDEHLHPELVRAKAQTFIDATQAKIDEDRAWAEKMKTLIPA